MAVNPRRTSAVFELKEFLVGQVFAAAAPHVGGDSVYLPHKEKAQLSAAYNRDIGREAIGVMGKEPNRFIVKFKVLGQCVRSVEVLELD
ncbi:hypothetical protein FRC00_003665 [Tulasnella sp. 408]|nr:hypothetical protein FRC00_003665 [Tulasnella sp. 408]